MEDLGNTRFTRNPTTILFHVEQQLTASEKTA
jgi:hypothetical protein